ncbi:MAG: DUF559 domain-containing protein, partial [Chloroflexi bacterium]|nr:DUF559 domain-containing protein [Chloroflexota bacterium]
MAAESSCAGRLTPRWPTSRLAKRPHPRPLSRRARGAPLRKVLERAKSIRHVVGIARRLRREATAAEETLWSRLRNRGLMGAKFRRQHPLGRYIADFYCQEARLVIELDGGVHSQHEQKQFDDARQSSIEASGITVLRINY